MRLGVRVNFRAGFSSAASGLDNPVKPFQDCLQKKYNFNDSKIFVGHQEKFKVKKGDEYIKWELVAR